VTFVATDQAHMVDQQRVIVEVFRDVLNRDHVDANDDYFDLGGDSLGALRIVNRLQARLAIKLRLIDLARNPTPAALALLVDERRSKSGSTVVG
jgi:acyl carrier protein